MGVTATPGRSGVTARELWEDYRRHEKRDEDRHEVWTYYVARPLSFPLTALCLRLGISANQATGLSVGFFGAGALLLAFGSPGAALLGALLVNAWLVVDCIDGNIARYTGTASAYGGFADAVSGYVVLGSVCFSAGLGAFAEPSQTLLGQWLGWGRSELVFAIVLGAWASLAALWIRLVYQKWQNTFPEAGGARHDLLPSGPDGRPSPLARAARFGNNLLNVSGLLLPLLLLATALGALDAFVALAAVGNTGILALALRKLLVDPGRR
jgi:phosphatidylglycerophosphate synthase